METQAKEGSEGDLVIPGDRSVRKNGRTRVWLRRGGLGAVGSGLLAVLDRTGWLPLWSWAKPFFAAIWSYPAFTDGWFLGLMVSDMVSFLPRHFTERGKVHRGRGEQPGELRSTSVAPVLHLRFRPHG